MDVSCSKKNTNGAAVERPYLSRQIGFTRAHFFPGRKLQLEHAHCTPIEILIFFIQSNWRSIFSLHEHLPSSDPSRIIGADCRISK